MIIIIKISLSLTATNQALVCPYHDISGQGQLRPAWGIWAAFDPLPLVTLIKYIDFRVFRVSGVSWGNLNRIHIWGTKWEFHRGTHVNL